MEDHAALVTGAAGGIGAATLRALAVEGVRVAAVDVTGDHLATEVGKLSLDGVPVTAYLTDVTDAGPVDIGE